MNAWYLKKGSEKKFRSGHPWVFSSELAQSPKSVVAGGEVELRDFQGAFLARGYGHPNSLISFRTLTLEQAELVDEGLLLRKLQRAARLREIAGLAPYSHRLCFAEGDYLPGLVIDRYILAEGQGQVFVMQSSTAGMDRLTPLVFSALEQLVKGEVAKNSNTPSWSDTSIVVANDSKSRLMENLTVEPKRVAQAGRGFSPESARLVVQPGLTELKPLVFEADMVQGQKTGFFLDQRFNVQIASRYVANVLRERKKIRVLDLCCYIGQWGTQMSHLAMSLGAEAEVTCVDASARALEFAARNVQSHGGIAKIEKIDVMDGLENLPRGAYDVVICDPPAFIKKKKDLPTGSQAYYKMNREAIRKVAPGGFYISCSCSGLFGEEDFRTMLSKVTAAYGPRMHWLARGGHSPDHPQRPEFPQGTYLKSWMGFTDLLKPLQEPVLKPSQEVDSK